MNARNTDPPIKITREIPLSWLMAMLIAAIGWAISQYVAASKIADATQSLTLRVEKMSEQLRQKEISDAHVAARIEEHERRIVTLESVRMSNRVGR